MAKKYYQIMVRHYFPCQDGYDYIDGEYSGVIHTRKADAYKELREARAVCTANVDDPFIEEIENG